MLSTILFLNLKGEILLSRAYRDDVSRATIDLFRSTVIARATGSTVAINSNNAAFSGNQPVHLIDNCSFLHIRVADVFIVAVSRKNANSALIFSFILRLVDVFQSYFDGVFDEESIKKNFVLMFELLDECCDFGYPQLTAINILSAYIQMGNAKSLLDKPPVLDAGITSEITGNVDWRQPGKFFYRKNQVFIDVHESVNLLMNNKGAVLRSDVSGKVMMKAFLSGMPECIFGMNDKLLMEKETQKTQANRASRPVNSNMSGIVIDDVSFHRCVKLGQFENDRTITFTPPDGEFELMKYRITENINLPFRVIPVITEHGRNRMEIEVQLKGSFNPKLFASDIIMRIPTPPNVSKTILDVGIGKAKFKPVGSLSLESGASQSASQAQGGCIIWKISRFAGDASVSLKAEVRMLTGMEDKNWSRPPITLEFQVPMFTASGLHVRFMRVFERSNYQTVNWVRYLTKAGTYQIRM